jgi:hypothetical protein
MLVFVVAPSNSIGNSIGIAMMCVGFGLSVVTAAYLVGAARASKVFRSSQR